MLQDTSKTPQDVPRHLQDAIRCPLDTSKSRFWWILELKMDPSWHQNHIQKQYYVKTARKQKIPIFQKNLMIFHNSGIDFWRQNPSKINCKMTSKIAYLNLTFFGLKIKHKIPPRRSQDAHMTPQEDPRRSKTSSRRLQDASKTTPRRLPDASRYSQDALKTALNLPRHPKMLPRRPKRPQDASKTPPRRLQT